METPSIPGLEVTELTDRETLREFTRLLSAQAHPKTTPPAAPEAEEFTIERFADQ